MNEVIELNKFLCEEMQNELKNQINLHLLDLENLGNHVNECEFCKNGFQSFASTLLSSYMKKVSPIQLLGMLKK